MQGGTENFNKVNQRVLPALALSIAVVGAAAAYALLYPVLLSDTVELSDRTSLRQAVQDNVGIESSFSERTPVRDDIDLRDEPALSGVPQENLMISDSAQVITAMHHEVNVTSALGIAGVTSDGTSTREELAFEERHGLQNAVQESLSIVDSVGKLFLVFISDMITPDDQPAAESDQTEEIEIEQETDRDNSGSRGPDRIVYNTAYFNKPLAKTKVVSLDFRDLNNNVPSVLDEGQEVSISALLRNYQNEPQGVTMFVQITDHDDIAVAVIQASGSIQDGESRRLDAQWTPQRGEFFLKAFLTDNFAHPSVISESFIKAVVVN